MSSSGLWPAPVPHPGACIVAGFSKQIRATADASASAPLRPAKRPANATAKPSGSTNRPTPITSRDQPIPSGSVSGAHAPRVTGSGPVSRPIRPATADQTTRLGKRLPVSPPQGPRSPVALQEYACGEPFNYPQVSTVKNPENLEKLIYNRFGLL